MSQRRLFLIGVAAVALSTGIAGQSLAQDLPQQQGYPQAGSRQPAAGPSSTQPTAQPLPGYLQNLTPEQRERLGNAAAPVINGFAHPVQRDIPQLNHFAETHADQMQQDVDILGLAVDPNYRSANGVSRQEAFNDPQYARNLSHSVVSSVNDALAIESELGHTLRPAIQEGLGQLPGFMDEIARVAQENGASPAELNEIRNADRYIDNTMPVALDSALGTHDTNVRRARSYFDENRQQIEDQLTPVIQNIVDQYGPDMNRWPPQARDEVNRALPPIPRTPYTNAAGGIGGSGLRALPNVGGLIERATGSPGAAAPATSPRPAPAASGPPAAPAAPAEPTTNSDATSRGGPRTPARRGTIPVDDPEAMYRVPASQGGTGPEPPPSSASTTSSRSSANAGGGARVQTPPPQPPPPPMTVPPTRLPRERGLPEAGRGTSNGIDLTIDHVPTDRQAQVEGAQAGSAAAHAGGQAGNVARQSARNAFSGAGPTPPRGNPVLTPAGPVDFQAAIQRYLNRDTPAGRTLTQAQRNALQHALDSIPYLPDGSIDTRGMYNRVRDVLGAAADLLFPPTETASAGSRAGRAAGEALASAATGASSRTPVEDNTPPRPVPTAPDYPTARPRGATEVAAAAARRAAAEAARAMAEQAAREAAARAAAEAAERAAMVERARVNDENHRLFQAAVRQAAQDNAWARMVASRFDNHVWEDFRNGGTLTVLQLEDIYRGYDPLRSIPPAMSLSSAGTSLSSAGNSLSLAGTAVVTGMDDYRDPAVQSLYEALYGLTQHPYARPGATERAQVARTAYHAGSYDLYADPTGRWGRESGGYVAASLFSEENEYLRLLTANGLSGLDRLLAQPFNVILTWGPGAFDLDLHMTGPTGEGNTDRFHIYYAAAGNLQDFPFASLIRDCICNSGSEVILTSALMRGGVYRVSVFNFGDPSANSTNLSNQSNAVIQIVRGGEIQPVGSGTTIIGGHTILTINVPNGQFGNTWIAAELDPRSGRITVPRAIVQNPGSADVN